MGIECDIFQRSLVWLRYKGFYGFEYNTEILRIHICFADKSFLFDLHCGIGTEIHNLLKLFHAERTIAICKSLFECFR